ncbi:MAG: histidinol-phosphate transaminase [Myxococcota bacterium]|nr:histidinol-phosphate transaminase [Myxococcota bacterium]
MFRSNVERMTAYSPGEQPVDMGRVVKLNTNENPYPPSPHVLQALKELPADALRRYPDPDATRLRSAAARAWSLASPSMVLAGNGSDDLLTIVLRAFAGEGDAVSFPWPTYSLYKTLCAIQNARALAVSWEENYRLPQGLVHGHAKLVIVANPNAPSGTFVPVADLEALARSIEGVLVIDEAYVDFAEDSFLRVIAQHDNVIVLRTLSKSYSLAGARIGFAVAAPALITGLHKVKDSYNVDAMCLAMGEAALGDAAHLRATVLAICDERARLSDQLSRLGFDVVPSHANFVLARRPAPTAKGIYEALKARGVLVRYFDDSALLDALRITVGRPEDTEALLSALHEVLRT